MATIKNLTGRLVSLRLNSGITLHVPPGTTSQEIVDVEVQPNAEVQKLKEQHVIEVRGIVDPTGRMEKPVTATEHSADNPPQL